MRKRRHYRPPRLAAWLLNRILPDDGWQTPLGDFEEYYNDVAAYAGEGRARLWYWGQVLNVLPRKGYHSAFWGIIMFPDGNAEEFILLAVWRLQDDAYSIPIRKQISQITGRNWSLGAVYMPLERLFKKGFLEFETNTHRPVCCVCFKF